MATETQVRRMKVGIAGVGQGARQVIRAAADVPKIELIAAADIRPEARSAFESRYGRAYDSMEKLCNDPDVETIWISTPNQFHCEHTVMAANHGKHVVIEKPMALNMAEAEQMVEATERNKTKLLCGHTASLMAAYQAMYRVVKSGELGKVRALNVWSYNTWLLLPRMPQEVNVSTGGGVVYRQAPHQVDTIRMLGGGMVRSVRATTGQWLPERDVPGYYAVFLEFEDGTPATIIKNGNGYFSTYEFVPWAGEGWSREETIRHRNELRSNSSNETDEKRSSGFGGTREQAMPRLSSEVLGSGYQGDLGVLLVSCERGDIRQSANGLMIYDDQGVREMPVEGLHDERMAELDEMYDAVTLDRPVRHDARWGMATLEVIMAIMESGRERKEIMMSHQTPTSY